MWFQSPSVVATASFVSPLIAIFGHHYVLPRSAGLLLKPDRPATPPQCWRDVFLQESQVVARSRSAPEAREYIKSSLGLVGASYPLPVCNRFFSIPRWLPESSGPRPFCGFCQESLGVAAWGQQTIVSNTLFCYPPSVGNNRAVWKMAPMTEHTFRKLSALEHCSGCTLICK